MRRAKYGARALLLALTLLVSLVVSSGTASAVSDYDDVFDLAGSAKVSDTYDVHTCAARDIATSWVSYLMDDSRWDHAVYGAGTNREAVQAALSTALGNESGVAVVERKFHAVVSVGDYVFDNGDTGVQIVFTPDADNETSFFTSGGLGYAALKGTGSAPVYVVVLGQYWNSSTSSCSIGVAVSRTVSSDASNSTFLDKEAYVGRENFEGANYTWKQLFVDSSIIYPTGYEGQLAAAELPAAEYVTLGDSFSSGEGNPPFDAGTDEDNVNGCHRSLQAYPRLLQNDLEFVPTAFMACSGATTANITGGQWNESAQTAVLTDEADIITLTIGGNDVGFADYVLGCFVACGPGTSIYDAMMDGISQPAFKANLVYAYEEILEEASGANLYVADYPYLAPSSVTTCWGLDFSGAYEVQEALNGVIHDAVAQVAATNSRIHAVETNYTGSPFENGYLCGGSGPSLFSGLVLPPNTEYSLHPNVAGHAAYAAVFAQAIG